MRGEIKPSYFSRLQSHIFYQFGKGPYPSTLLVFAVERPQEVTDCPCDLTFIAYRTEHEILK